jgi:hypothetical protein
MTDPQALTDLASPRLILPSIFALVILLAVAIAFLPAAFERAKRSLALLIVLIASFGALLELLPRGLGAGASVALFFGLFVVFFLLGRFDSSP